MVKRFKKKIDDKKKSPSSTQPIKHKKLAKDRSKSALSGSFIRHPKGFGFVVIDTDPSSKEKSADVFIPASKTLGAFDGDLVEIEIRGTTSPKGPEGEIIRITKRSSMLFVAIVKQIRGDGYELFSPSFGKGKPILIPLGQDLQVGQRVLVQMEDANEKGPIWASVIKELGHIDDPASDIPFACAEFQISPSFPKEVLKEVSQLPSEIDPKAYPDRLDLTGEVIFTIDPADSKDHDDALSIKQDDKGCTLGVHIADVSYFVPQGSFLDKEALLRSNSTYFPGICVPMLPYELSNHLCSLEEGKVRMAVSLLVRFDLKGNLIKVSSHRSLIRSCRKFSYEEAFMILEGKKQDLLSSHLIALDHLASQMRQARRLRGSVDLAMKETKILVDAAGNPTGVTVIEYDRAHQLVEECMLKANQLVAELLSDRKQNTLYRIHEAPMDNTMEQFSIIAQQLGFDLPSKPKAEEIQQLFEIAKNTPHLEQLSIAFIRSMKLASYSENNVGHFGLCLSHYSHFTSPIRRYSDLVVHRTLLDKSKDEPLEEIAQRCSDQERRSFRAEMRVVNLKKLRLLNRWKKEGKSTYQGYISRIKPFGLTFEIPEIAFEGTLALPDLGGDFYIYLPEQQAFIGKSSKERLAVGIMIEVYLDRIDLITMEAHFTRLPPNVYFRKKKK